MGGLCLKQPCILGGGALSCYKALGWNVIEQFIEQSIVKAKRNPRFDYEMAVILRSTEQLVGSGHIARESEDSRVGSIGYAINPNFQKHGYGAEIATSLIKFGFSHLDLLVIYVTCDTRNLASIRVLEKSGMHRVGHMIGDRKIRGKIYDSYKYEILRK